MLQSSSTLESVYAAQDSCSWLDGGCLLDGDGGKSGFDVYTHRWEFDGGVMVSVLNHSTSVPSRKTHSFFAGAGKGVVKAVDFIDWDKSKARNYGMCVVYDFVESPVRQLLRKINGLESSGREREAGRLVMSYIESCFQRHDIAQVDEFLQSLNIPQRSAWATIGALRTTFRVRRQLPSWNDTLNEARSVLDSKGLDSTVLLMGLKEV